MPSQHYKKGSRDGNEKRLLKVANAYGYLDFDEIVKKEIPAETVTRFYQKRHSQDGHDVIFYDEHGAFCVEIKTDEWGEWARKLGEREIVFRDVCANVGILWYRVVFESDMQRILEGRIVARP